MAGGRQERQEGRRWVLAGASEENEVRGGPWPSCSTITTWVFAGNMYGTGTVWNGGIRDCSIPNIGNVEATKSMPFKREQTYQPDVGCALLLWEYGP